MKLIFNHLALHIQGQIAYQKEIQQNQFNMKGLLIHMSGTVRLYLGSFITIIFFSTNSYCQWINPKVDPDLYQKKLNEIQINEENKEHFSSSFRTICSCDLLFKNTDTSNYIVKYYFRKNEDLVFFELKYKSGKLLTGYFKKVIQLCDEDKIYCWVQDLVWYYFDENNRVEKIEIYAEGKVSSHLFEE